jgi:O-antigen/teichoic acid export membrane protein
MLHPLFSTLIKRPDLIADHVSAYPALISQESSGMAADWLQRGMAWALVAVGLLVFVVLTGIGLMLAALHPFHWALVAVPSMVLLFTLLAFLKARRPTHSERFTELKAQVDSDMRALREAAE